LRERERHAQYKRVTEGGRGPWALWGIKFHFKAYPNRNRKLYKKCYSNEKKKGVFIGNRT